MLEDAFGGSFIEKSNFDAVSLFDRTRIELLFVAREATTRERERERERETSDNSKTNSVSQGG